MKPGPKGPTIKIDWPHFEELCVLHCTQQDIANFFKCSPDTIARHVKEHYGENFAEVFKRYSASGKVSIRRKMFAVAETGNVTMLIWLSKQHLGMKDKHEEPVNEQIMGYALKALQLSQMPTDQLTGMAKDLLDKVVPIHAKG